MANQYQKVDQILDDLLYSLDDVMAGTSKGHTSVKKDTSNKTTVKRQMPFVSNEISVMVFKSRKKEVLTSLDNIVFNNYSANRKDGFNSAIANYKKIIEDSNNFKNIDKQIITNLNEAKEKIKEGMDNFSLGYCDGLEIIKQIIYKSKLSKFRELANKYN